METRERESAPSLLPSYAKAILGALVPGGSDELPDHGVALNDVEIDPERVAAFNRVCGCATRCRPPTRTSWASRSRCR
jgi:hypothetical protein